MPLILGTAGHIDHGKTTLVQALTGINCDRLEEERRRGITIELGFAWLDLPGGERLGIVDVPGHERFVRAMVAGASGMDLVMLVVAADEGVMPQTREHLDICGLLGVRGGLVALTKCDLVDADWLALVREELASFLKGSFLEGCPVFPVSAASGEGVDALRAHLVKSALDLAPRRGAELFRLPVDRVFSMKGFGTVVTGSVLSGRLSADADAELSPSGRRVHVRGLQRHGLPSREARAGERCAANLQGVDAREVRRGETLCLPGTLFPSPRWIARLSCLRDSPLPLRSRAELHFHHGTFECLATLALFDRPQLAPGETALAELRFPRALPGVFGDRCVLRSFSPLRAVAGGLLLSPLPPELRARDPERAEKLALLESLQAFEGAGEGRDADLVAAVLSLRGGEGARTAVLRVLTGLPKRRLDKALQTLSSSRLALCFDREAGGWIGAKAFEGLRAACLARAEELHARSPLRAGFPRAALEAGWAQGLPARLPARVLDSLVGEGRLELSGELLSLGGHSIALSPRQRELSERLLELHERAELSPPNLKDALAELGASEREALPLVGLLQAEGRLVRVREGLYYSGAAMGRVLDGVEAWFGEHDDLSLADMKAIFGLSRKFLIALLEYLDGERVTVRLGDRRQFRGRPGGPRP